MNLSFFTVAEYPPSNWFTNSEFPTASTCRLELTMKNYHSPEVFCKDADDAHI